VVGGDSQRLISGQDQCTQKNSHSNSGISVPFESHI